jgi:hypothetical protein
MKVEEQPCDQEAERGDDEAVHDLRQRPAEEQRHPVRRRREQGGKSLRPALAADRHRDAVDARHRRDLDGVADDVERIVSDAAEAAEVGEEEHLEERVAQHRRDVERRALPAEEGAIAHHAAQEEDAQAVHTSERDAFSRARRSKMCRKPWPITR